MSVKGTLVPVMHIFSRRLRIAAELVAFFVVNAGSTVTM